MRVLLPFTIVLSFTFPLFSLEPLSDYEAKRGGSDSVTLSRFDPTTSIMQKSENLPRVNIITGEYIEEETDFVVAGSEPLSLRRFYNHFAPSDGRYGSWRINPETYFAANFELGGFGLTQFASVGFADGSVSYLDKRESSNYCQNPQKEGLCNLSHTISGQTNPINTKVSYSKRGDPKNKERWQWKGTITDGTGAMREFDTPMHKWHKTNLKVDTDKGESGVSPITWTPYVLTIHSEKKPNGNVLEYTYARWRDDKLCPRPYLLSSITAYNSTKTKVLNQLNFNYNTYCWKNEVKTPIGDTYRENVGEVASYSITGTDGRTVSYQHNTHKNFNPTFLHNVHTPTHAIHMDYKDDKLFHVARADGRIFTTEYHPNTHKVSCQKAPVGPDGEVVPIARYIYHDNSTEMFDAEDNKTHYFFDTNKRITQVHHFAGNSLFQIEENCWDEKGWLTSKTLKNSNNSIILKTTYLYDERGNILEETLSNQEESYTINRTYSDDGFNLKLSESDGFGKTARFSYVSGTNLLAQELLYDGETLKTRTSYTYDDCAICIQKIVDDGPETTYCTITRTIPRYEHPCFGLPETVEKLTLDDSGNEILLSKVEYTYHSSGKILTEAHYDANNQHRYTLTNAYDDRERLVAKNDALGHGTNYAYDANNNLTAQHGPRKDMYKTWTYDRANRSIQETERISEGRDLITLSEYDKLGRALATTDPFGNKTSYNYDVLGRVTCITHPDGGQEFKEYDLLGNVTKEIDPLGHITTCSYTLRGKPKDVTHPNGTQESFTYNPNGTLHTHIDQNGATTIFIYDIFENPLKQEVYSCSGELLKTTSATYTPFVKLSETDAEGITTYFTYDKSGRKISETVLDRTVTFSYDALGNLTTTEKDDIQNIDTFDLNGQLLQNRAEDLQGTLLHQEDYCYDPAGNRTHVVISNGITESGYDSRGQILWTKDPLGHTTTTQYSYTDHLTITSQDPKKLTTITHYDKRGRPLEVTLQNSQGETLHKECKSYDLCGNQISAEQNSYKGTTYSDTITHRWEYGPSGRVEKMVESDQKQTLYAYDNHGRVETITKPTGVQIHHRYDNLGRLTRFFSSYEDINYHYSYDRNDNLLSIYDAVSDKTTQRQYDAYGNLIQEELANGLIFQSTYDTYGKRTVFTLPDQSRVEYIYKAGDLFSVNRNGQSYTYQVRDLEGEISQITLPNQLGAINYTRDALSRIKEQNAPHYRAYFPEEAYDTVGNLCHYSYTDPQGEFNATFSYDTLNQLSLENGHSYTYDSLGNRLEKDSAVCTVNNLCQITSDGEKEYTYDANGNLLTDGESYYFYDSLDRLIRVTKGSMIITFTYDPLHRRLTKQIEDIELAKFSLNFLPVYYNYLWDGENEIGTMLPNREVIDLRILGEGLGAEIGAACFFEHDGKSYVPIHDHRGALVTLIDMETGEAEESYRYTAFGEELTENKLSPWRFSSKRHDEETGLIFFGRRYYHPHLGRWITADPQGFEDGPNLYAYLHNCPMMRFDLYGLFDMGNFWPTLFDLSGVAGMGLNFFGVGREKNYMTFENQFQNKSYNFDLSDDDRPNLPIGEIGRTNGMGNNKRDARKAARTLSDMAGGFNVKATHNETHNPFFDSHEAVMNFWGISTNPVKKIHERWDRFFDNNPGDTSPYEECHSQGVPLVECALSTYPKSRRDRIIVAAFAPAAYISPQLCKQVTHYVSDGDKVHKFDIVGRMKYKDTIVTLPRHPDAKGRWDHSILSPTFAAARRRGAEKYLESLKIK